MSPFYIFRYPLSLSEDDKQGIQYLYGKPKLDPDPTPTQPAELPQLDLETNEITNVEVSEQLVRVLLSHQGWDCPHQGASSRLTCGLVSVSSTHAAEPRSGPHSWHCQPAGGVQGGDPWAARAQPKPAQSRMVAWTQGLPVH